MRAGFGHDVLHEIASTVISALKLLWIIPIVTAIIVLSGWDLRLLVQPWFWLALMIVLVAAGRFSHMMK
jgi:hypothetical protein